MRHSYVLYHADCVDGFTAAWAAWRSEGYAQKYLPVRYGEPPPPETVGQQVILLDFSYPLATLRELAAEGTSIEIHDHHASAIDALSDSLSKGEFRGVLDARQSGAMLAWQRFNPEPLNETRRSPGPGRPDTGRVWGPTQPPQLVRYVQDRDLWRWELDWSREISAWIASWPFDFDAWDTIAFILENERGASGASNEGMAILRAQERQLERLTARAEPREIAGHIVPVVNSSLHHSEIGEVLGEGVPFVAIYHDEPGRRAWALRSRFGSDPVAVDVAEVARQFGGGGHQASAGFQTDLAWMPAASAASETTDGGWLSRPGWHWQSRPIEKGEARPMTGRELEALGDHLATGAKETFRRDGQHGPTLYLRIRAVPFSFAVSLDSEAEKTAVRLFFEVAARGGAEACGLIIEGWSAGGDAASLTKTIGWAASGRSLAEMPGRREVLFIEVASPVAHVRRQFVIDRQGTSVRLRKTDAKPGVSRYLTDLPWMVQPSARQLARRKIRKPRA